MYKAANRGLSTTTSGSATRASSATRPITGAGPGGFVEVVGGGGAGVGIDESVAIGVVVELIAELSPPPLHVVARTGTAAPPRSANPHLASELIESSLSSHIQSQYPFIARLSAD
jgi:hypothetical protein